ncbi:BRO-N domain-containing protein [Clostridium cadaveris]
MNNQVQIFKNEKLNFEVKMKIGNGEELYDAETVARSLGLVSVSAKGGRKYENVRWSRVNKYLKLFGTSFELKQGDFISEPMVYKLAFKANNDVAENFQDWLAVDVIPKIRKTGSYKSNQNSINPELKEKEIEARLKNARAREANILLKICSNPNLSKEYVQVLQSKATEIITGQAILPLPVAERKTYSATEIGNKLGISANKVGSLANKHNLKNDEYGKFFHDKSPYSAKEVESFRYYEEVIPVLKSLI